MDNASTTTPAKLSQEQVQEEERVGVGAYIAFAFAVCLFSGVFLQDARKPTSGLEPLTSQPLSVSSVR